MKLGKSFFLLATLLVVLTRAEAQTALSIYTNDVTPAFVTIGDTFSFVAFIRNDSSNIHNGSLRLNYTINGSLYATSNDSSGIEFDTIPALIAPGDSIPVYLKVNVSQPRFITGPSVVVIWPIRNSGAQVYAKDSLVLSFVVTPAVGISDPEDERLKLYIINRSLQIKKDTEIQLRRVRIFDILGREILNKLNPSDNIPLLEMDIGIYWAEVTYNNNQRAIFRFYY